jgi:hypothetical protein
MDIAALVEQMNRDGAFKKIINNPLAQLGRKPKRYLGAELLPEKDVPANKYTEQGIKYRSIIANSGTRYGPSQLKGGVITGSFDVSLGESDIASQFTGPEYDTLLDLLSRAGQGPAPQEAVRNLLQWVDVTVNVPLVELLEKQRWDAIVSAQVVRVGDNKYTETVNYSNPTGHRVAAGGVWSNNAYDPYTDIMNQMDFMVGKGYEVNRIFASRTVISKLAMNTLIRTRVGRISIASGTVLGLAGRASIDEINALFSQDGLPPIEEYNLTYNTDTSFGRFLPTTVFVMVGTTGRDVAIDLGTAEPIPLRDTLGYTAIGRAQGQTVPGRHLVDPRYYDTKPVRVECEGWQTAAPVITEPEAISVITGIS